MPVERFFCENDFKENETVILSKEETFHLCKVLRRQPGERVELINGHSQLGFARLHTCNHEGAVLLIESFIERPCPHSGLILCIGMPKFNRIEWIVEKGTELGVSAFWFFDGELSEKASLSEKQHSRLLHIVISALKQCGRLDLPRITLKPSLLRWQKPQGTLLFGDTSPNAPCLNPPYPLPIFFFSGPEKGFSKKEQDLFNQWNAKGVSLCHHILRADTAPIAAAAILGPRICADIPSALYTKQSF